MDWITTSGQSIDEAKSNALDQLGIVADEAEFDVVNDVEKGFLGRIKTEAMVRARVRPKAPTVREDRSRRSKPKRGGAGKNGGGRSKGATKQENGQRRSKGSGDNSTPKSKNSPGRSGKGQKKPQQSNQASEPRKQAPVREKQKPQETKKDDVEHEFSRQEQVEVAIEFLGGLLDVFEIDGSVALAEEAAEDNAIEIDVTGTELGLLVGPKGNTLGAVQELTRTVVQRNSGGARTERLRVDIGGYRERRNAALREFAQKIAGDVLDTSSERVLEPMGPADRKVVHDTIAEMDGVATGSEGEEPRRRVVIRPE